MVKKLLTLCLGLFMMCGIASAQTESTIAADDILYWVGEGDDQAILVVDFGTTALAWGYRFDEADNLTVDDMITDVMDADPRFYSGYDENYDEAYIFVQRPQYQLSCVMGAFKVNQVISDLDLDEVDLEDGMFVKLSSETDGVWSTPIVAVSVKEVPVDAEIEPSNVTYWVGEGANSAVIAVDWSNPGVALAWGVRFDGSKTVTQIFDYLAANDSRVTVESNSINFDEGSLHLAFQDVDNNYLQFIVNGNGNAGWSTNVPDGSFIKVGESLFAEGVDSAYWDGIGWFPTYVVWTTPVQPVFEPLPDPLPTTATISADAITYWVGNGENKMIFVVNWPDTSLAWGYKFSTATIDMTTVMDDIKAADSRFDYEVGDGGLNNITFTEGNVSLTGASYWNQLKNGISGMGMGETFQDGDINLWGDAAAGVVVDRFSYPGWGIFPVNAYPMTIHPVSAPQTDAIREASAVSVSIYPNPASVRFNVVCGGLDNDTEAVLYDMTGRKVYSQTVNAGTTSISVETSNLTNGIYMLHIGGNTSKVVVRH